MNRYYLSIDVTGYKVYAVDAESEDIAIEKMNFDSEQYLVEDKNDNSK